MHEMLLNVSTSFAGSKAWKYHSLTLSVWIHKNAISQIPRSQILKSQVLKSQNPKIPKSQNPKIPKSQNLKISKSQHPKIQNSQVTISQITKHSIPKSQYYQKNKTSYYRSHYKKKLIANATCSFHLQVQGIEVAFSFWYWWY